MTEPSLKDLMDMTDIEFRGYEKTGKWSRKPADDFTDYGDHLLNPRTGTCPMCGGNMCDC